MSTPLTNERPRCGVPCLTHTHSCDRSSHHTGPHRDVQQKGNHTCEWATPGPQDIPALLAEVERLQELRWAAWDEIAAILSAGISRWPWGRRSHRAVTQRLGTAANNLIRDRVTS